MNKALLAMVLVGRCGMGPGTPDGGSPDASRPVDAALDAARAPDAAAGMDARPVDSGRDAARDAGNMNRDAGAPEAGCGDGVIGPGETCDPPRPPGSGGQLCDSTCHIPTCGNLMVDPGETCDPPDDVTCDRGCQSIPIVCGNGIAQPGESCDLPPTSPSICQNCGPTPCGGCFFDRARQAGLCAGLDTADLIACSQLIVCVVQSSGSCTARSAGHDGCFCSRPDSLCSAGIDGQCAAQYEAVAHSTDPAVIIRQMDDITTVLGKVTAAAVAFSARCGSICSRQAQGL
ncbi:MAG TPA: hypothetical protein VN962_14245 [Polyangia bacterium]|nr:hypothetical protein [Polyangia bacterium]